MIIKLSFPEYGCITGCDLHNSLIININRGAGGFLTFGRVARSIQTHYLDIINFFERRATNAEAE